MADYYTPQVDYQSRDFAAIRDDLVNLIPNFAPQWTSRDSSDFGIVLIELFSYMGDLLNYYIDRAANEGFMATATQRETVLNLARVFGYTPAEPTPAQYNITASNISTVSSATVKSLAQFSTEQADANGDYIYFENLNSDVVIGTSTSTTVAVTEGRTMATTQVSVSDGTPDQTYPIYDDQLVYASSLWVNVGGTIATTGVVTGGVVYSKVDNLIDWGPDDTKFSAYYDGNNILNLRFGDGVSGKIPPINSPIFVQYRKGLGGSGNVGASTITNIVSNSGSDYSTLDVNNTSGTPTKTGTDPESMDSIRINAPRSLRALNRAVSLSDYIAIAENTSGVSKANAVAEMYSSVLVFVMGKDWNGLTASEISTVKSSFVDKTPPGTIVTVINGSTAFPAVAATVTCIPTANNATVKANVLSALKSLFAFDNVTFNDLIYLSDVYKEVKSVDGVNDVSITGFERRATSTTVASTTVSAGVYFYANEVPKWNADNFVITAVGGTD